MARAPAIEADTALWLALNINARDQRQGQDFVFGKCITHRCASGGQQRVGIGDDFDSCRYGTDLLLEVDADRLAA